MRAALLLNVQAVKNILMRGTDPKPYEKYLAEADEGVKTIKEVRATLEKSASHLTSGERDVLKRFDASLADLLAAWPKAIQACGGIAGAAEQMAGGARTVVDAMQGISTVVEQSSAATALMAAQAGDVTAAIQSIASVAEENSAATEEVSASAEEISPRWRK